MSYLCLSQFCYVMNKKFIICGAIAVGLLLAACSSKKEEAHPDEQQAQSEQTNNPASEQFHSINENSNMPASDVAPPAKKVVKIQREETENTSTEIRSEVKDADTATPTTNSSTSSTTGGTTGSSNNNSTSNSQVVTEKKPESSKKARLSEDDAVAAAIAAAKPALSN
ncbi:hypothetical protein C9426_07240 [Serratia sp. S1B]|nr:hypothetical protein C9426_07240 [Serratia sp. S1B]